MSYEGRTQYLCQNRHLYTRDVYDSNDLCEHCGKSPVFQNGVDDTNCDEWGIIPPSVWEQLLLAPETVEVCNLNHKHVTAAATYRVPTAEERPLLRGFWDDRAEQVRPIEAASPFYK